MAQEKNNQTKIAVIRIRGITGVDKRIRNTMDMLGLYHNNYCTIVYGSMFNMVRKAKDYVTWGEINDDTLKMLVEKRGEEYKGRETDSKNKIKYKNFILINGKKYKKYFRLSPPRKGFERKGIKVPFSKGGSLGYRKEKINDLIKRMI